MLETAEEVLSLNKKENEVNLVPKLSTEITKQDLSNRVGVDFINCFAPYLRLAPNF